MGSDMDQVLLSILHYICLLIPYYFFDAEFWKQVPPNEPYRVILGDLRDKLYQTRERSRHLLANGISDIPPEATFTNVEQVSLFLPL